LFKKRKEGGSFFLFLFVSEKLSPSSWAMHSVNKFYSERTELDNFSWVQKYLLPGSQPIGQPPLFSLEKKLIIYERDII
jgi:hypothetical protein